MAIEYGLWFADGKSIVRYPTLELAEAAKEAHVGATLVFREVSDWTPVP